MSDRLIDQIGSGLMTPQQAFESFALLTFSPEATSLPERYEIDPHYEEELAAATQHLEYLQALSSQQWEEMARNHYQTMVRDASNLHLDWSMRLERLEAMLLHVQAMQVDSALQQLKEGLITRLMRGVADYRLSVSQSIIGEAPTRDAFRERTLRNAQEKLTERQRDYDFHTMDVARKNNALAALRLGLSN